MASRDKKAWSSRARKIRTLSDLNRHSYKSDSDSDDDPHLYHTADQKRKLDQDPSKSNDVDAIFNEAKQVGAAELERLLSGETVPQQQHAAVAHDIVFWCTSNGFTVDDGPLRNLDDPQNASFLESIKKWECPKELEPVDGRTSVNVNLIKRNDKYTEPEKPRVPFQGVGRTLGVRRSNSTSTSGVVEANDTLLGAATPTPTPFAGPVPVVVDESLPSTSIQLRLAYGTRLVLRFNYHHRISDIRAFIDASSIPGRNYELQMMGFPPKILSDETQTIEQAGLANSVVIQKF